MLLPIDLHFYLFGTPQGFFLSVVGTITVASSCTACRTITVVLAVWIVCITVFVVSLITITPRRKGVVIFFQQQRMVSDWTLDAGPATLSPDLVFEAHTSG